LKYKINKISDSGSRSVLIIYTGGTFGMIRDNSGSLTPFNFGKVVDMIPVLKNLDFKLTVISFPKPIDSSNVGLNDWKDIAYIIEENYEQYHGFVVLHGPDTMAYSASMLSFMLQGLSKPVIFTGAQMPIGYLRSDARENLITALEIAGHYVNDQPVVSEVCVYFNYFLLRGNRSQKLRSSAFAAFESENYPVLAEAGIEIEYDYAALKPFDPESKLQVFPNLDHRVALLKLFPAIPKTMIMAVLDQPQVKGIIIESFGSGNTMSFDWFIKAIELKIKEGTIIMNVSQCIGGEVEQGRYKTSSKLKSIGVLSGGDITTEAAITKMMHLFGSYEDSSLIKQKLIQPICGEMDDQLL
jgi:L-asparaginase